MNFLNSQIKLLNETHLEEIKKLDERIQMRSSLFSLHTMHLPDPIEMIQRKSESFFCYGFFIRNQIEGYAVIYREKRFVEGKETLVWSAGRVRLSKKAFGLGFLLRLSEEAKVKSWFQGHGYAYTLKGNKEIENYISRSFKKFPSFPIMQLSKSNTVFIKPTCFPFASKRALDQNLEIQKTDASNNEKFLSFLLEEHSHYHLGRVYSKEYLDRLNTLPGATWFTATENGVLKGALFAWDSFQRNPSTVQISKYSWQPKIISISEFAVKNNEKTTWLSLLEKVRSHAKEKRISWIQCGGDESHPLHHIVKFPKLQIHSHLLEFNSKETTPLLHWCDSDLF